MSDLYFIHALDETTSFLNVFREHFKDNYYIIEPNKKSVEESKEYLQSISEDNLIVFLGHGHSSGLYTPESSDFNKDIFITSDIGNQIFSEKKVILLSCNSNQFINRLNTFRCIIGFGNILSSMNEVRTEADIETGRFRNVSEKDIEHFNNSYCNAIINALKKYANGLYEFDEIPKIIEFYINQSINKVLLDKQIDNRIEIARLLFEFRNEMLLIKR